MSGVDRALILWRLSRPYGLTVVCWVFVRKPGGPVCTRADRESFPTPVKRAEARPFVVIFRMRPIEEVAADLAFAPADLQPWGPHVVKISPEAAFRDDPLRGKLVLVSAINPTPAGEGKTT